MTDWYIDQMKTKTYESAPTLPLHDQYVGDKLDYVVHIPKLIVDGILKDLMSFIKTQSNQVQMQNGQTIHFTYK
jgi:hypothetical protein